MVQSEVFFCGFFPGIIALHTVLNHRIKSVLMIQRTGCIERVDTTEVVIVGEDKAGCILSKRDILDRIIESADIADDRKRSITHGNHLTGSAWFKIAGHQEEVTSRIKEMGKVLIITFDEVDIGIMKSLS